MKEKRYKRKREEEADGGGLLGQTLSFANKARQVSTNPFAAYKTGKQAVSMAKGLMSSPDSRQKLMSKMTSALPGSPNKLLSKMTSVLPGSPNKLMAALPGSPQKLMSALPGSPQKLMSVLPGSPKKLLTTPLVGSLNKLKSSLSQKIAITPPGSPSKPLLSFTPKTPEGTPMKLATKTTNEMQEDDTNKPSDDQLNQKEGEKELEQTPSDNPVSQMINDKTTTIAQINSILADKSMDPEVQLGKVRALQAKLQEISDNADAIEKGLAEPDIGSTSSSQPSTKPSTPAEPIAASTSQVPIPKSGGAGDEPIKLDDIHVEEKKPPTSVAKELDDIEKDALLEIAKADVKLVYDYVQKTNDPRALKALFEYQQGKDTKTDILSKHHKKLWELLDSTPPGTPLKKKGMALLNDIKLAQAKLYSINIEVALRRIEDQEADVSFFPDELKMELTEKQKRITNAILVVFAVVKYVVKQFAKAPTIVTVFTLLSLVFIVISAYLALKYCIMIVNDYTNNKLINNPTNAESLDFLIGNFANSPPREVNPKDDNARGDARSKKEIKLVSNPLLQFFIDSFKRGISPLFGNLLSAKYKYAWFVILPWISITFAILAIVFMIRKRNQLELTPGLVQAVLYAGMVQTLIALVANYSIFFYAFYVLKATSFRIDSYNKHVLANMSQRAEFLAYLQKLPTNTIAIGNVTGNALSTLFRNGKTPSVTELSKSIFTLNLYEHYQQLGFRNPILYEALDSFRIYNFIFSKQGFSPALYLRRKSTLIRDNGEKYRSRIEAILQRNGQSLDAYRTLVDNAIIRSSQITAEANNLANAFFPEDAMSRFLRMAVMIALVQFLPFMLFMYLFRNKDLRNGFIDAVRIMIGQKKNMENADLRDKEETVLELREMMKNKQNVPAPVEAPAPKQPPARL